MSIERRLKRFEKGKISLEALRNATVNATPEQWVQHFGQDKRYPEGDNWSREGGRICTPKKDNSSRDIVKKAVISSMGMAHQWMLDKSETVSIHVGSSQCAIYNLYNGL